MYPIFKQRSPLHYDVRRGTYNGQRPKKRLSASLVKRKNKCPIAVGVSGCIPLRICVNDLPTVKKKEPLVLKFISFELKSVFKLANFLADI